MGGGEGGGSGSVRRTGYQQVSCSALHMLHYMMSHSKRDKGPVIQQLWNVFSMQATLMTTSAQT